MKLRADLKSTAVALLKGGSIGIAILGFFLSGFMLRGYIAPAPAQQSADFTLLREVKQLLDEHYVRSVPEPREMEYGAIRGLMGVLQDPYTFFNPPVVTRSESDALAGQYGGIGVALQYSADGRIQLYPYPDTPAARAGIENGDVLVAINDLPVEGSLSLDHVRQMLRGEVGTAVALRILKHDSSDEMQLQLEFAVIEVPSVIWRVLAEDERLGYMHITLFTARTPDEVQAAWEALRSAEVQGLILDLRDNPGGLLAEAVQVADMFLDSGVIFVEQTRDEEHERRAEPGTAFEDVPIIVVVNSRTASAAELVAGALRDNGRAVLLGQRTTGKGSVQLIFPLADGSSVHITSAEWLTPNRQPLNAQGLEPDIPMIPAEDGRDVELPEAILRLQQELN